MKTTIEKNGEAVNISIQGRFSTDEAAGFLKDLEPVMEERNKTVTMDLAELDFISSAGIRCFVMLLKTCQANNSTLWLKNLTPQLKDIFTLTALIDKFNIA